MKDEKKTKAQLIVELQELRSRFVTGNEMAGRNMARHLRAEEINRKEQLSFDQLVATVPGAITILRQTADGHMNVSYASKAFEEFFGLESAQVSKNVEAIIQRIPPDDLPCILRHLQEMSAALQPIQIEFRYRHPMKGDIWLENRARPAQEQDGSISWFGVTSDITARKQAEEKIIHTERRYRALIENAPDGVVLIDVNGTFKYASPSIERLFGYTQEDLPCCEAAGLTHPDDLAMVLVELTKLMQDPTYIPTRQYRFRHKNGDWRWIESTFTNLLAEMNVEGIVINFRDIHERKLAEENLRSEKEKLEKIAASVPGVICSFHQSPTGHASMPYASPAVKEVYGLEPAEIADDMTPIFSRILPEDMAHVSATIARSAHTLEIWKDEFRYQHPTKGVIWMDGYSAPVREADGGITWHGFIADVTERKLTEEKLIESEKKYRDLINGMNDVICVIDHDTSILDVNTTATTVLGYSREELLSMKIPDIDVNLTPARILHLAGSMPADKTQVFETVHRTKDGRAFPVEVSSSLVSYGGRVVIMSISRDISDRKQSEKLLRQWADAFENCAHGIALGLPATGKILTCNPAFAGMQGRSIDEISSMPILSMYAPEDHEHVKNRIMEADRKGSVSYEAHMVRKDGTRYPVQMDVVSVRDEKGNLLYRVATQQDITERKQAEAKLRESEKRFSTIFQISPVGIILTQLEDGLVLDVNGAFLKLFGFQRQEVIGHTTTGLHVYPDPNDRTRFVARLKENGMLLYEEARFQQKSGEIGTVLVSAEIIELNDKKHLLSLMVDITERKRAEEELRQRKQELQTIFDLLPVGVSIMDPQRRLIEFNTALTNILAVPPEELSHGDFGKRRYLRGDGTAISFRELPGEIALQERKTVHNVQVGINREDGDTIWTSVSAASLPDGNVLIVTNDLTQHKLAEAQLEASERTLKLFVEYAPASIAMFDRSMNYIAASRRYIADYGLPDEHIIGRSHYEVFPEVPERWKEIHRRCLAGAIERAEEDAFPRADGTLDWVRWEMRPWYHQANEIGGVLLFSEVITERKRIQDQLKQNEESFKGLFEQNALPMWVYDPQTLAFLAVNDAAVAQYGYSHQEFLAMTIRDIRPAEDLEKLQDSLRKRTTTYEMSGPWQHLKKDGTLILVEIASHLITWQGRPAVIIAALDQTAQIHAEQALSASEVRFRELAENIQEVFWVYGHDEQRIVYISPAYEKIWGRTVESLHQDARSFLESVHPEDLPGMMDALQRQVRGEVTAIEYRIVRPDGAIGWIWDRSVPIIENGKLIRSIGVASDISERKQMEEHLRESERFLKESQKAGNMGSWRLDIVTKRAQWSENCYILYGYEPFEVEPTYERFVNAVHPDDRHIVQETIQQLTRDPRPANQELRIFDKSGRMKWVYSSLTPIIVDGRVTALSGIQIDITERKEAEQELKLSEERFSTAFFTSPVSQSIITKESNEIIEVNESCCHLFEYSRDELIGMHVAKLNLWENPADRLAALDEIHRTGQLKPSETTIRTKSGKIRTVISAIVPIAWKETPCLISFVMDITERKQAEHEKARLEEHLQRSQKLETIGTLAGGIAHDFNNILTPIMGYADMAIARASSSDPLAEDLKMIFNAANRAKDLVEQILIFSRQIEKEQKPLSLHLVVNEAVKLLRPTLPSTIEIIQRIDSSCPHVLADPTQMHQVVMNLCINAFHAMEEKGGMLTIELLQVNIDRATASLYPHLKEAEYARLSICDTGIGMEKETSDRIFEPFFTTKAPGKGTGMGLSVVHGIVRAHNGDIMVSSEPGKGTTFHVYLPTTAAELTMDKPKSAAMKSGHETILLVDDEVAVARMMNKMLEQLGYKADVCHSSLEALKVFRQQPARYDLVISDLTMPGMTGLDLAEQLHKIAKELPIILFSGYGKNLSNIALKERGIKKIIGKPILVKELALAIREALDN